MNKLLSFLAVAGLLVLLPVSALFAQDEQASQTEKRNNLRLAFELGTNVMSGTLEKPAQIRENRSTGHFYYDSGLWRESSSLRTSYFGVKPEYFIFNNRIGIASGLRFTWASSELTTSDKDKFLWKVKEKDLTTDYVRIDDIRHRAYLLGIPLEIRFFPNNRELPFQHYFKVGASFSYRIHSENEVNFTNKAMEKYNGLVLNQLPKGNAFSAFAFGAVGFKVGKCKEGSWIPWGNLEFQFPYVLLTDKSFAFVGASEDFFGVGFQCSFQIPIGKNAPMGSK